ncbi:hypothetical protein IQ268_03110 [Oculatella sp. LEGE 06141]|uniref:hypothetical protein n=1 Tax=Oculatella sp. LEGE 06141 TaxID=1828648 RepID=UPI001882931F|nr:hypothetical protein [Oculatella sp. LEGE 06141]MBE9177565.1 hypothetical protein [Oculatella sp. LEGE 06141]
MHNHNNRTYRQETYSNGRTYGDRPVQYETDDYRVINQTPTVANGNRVSPEDASYRDGYVRGRTVDRYQQDNVTEVRDNENAARGFLLGILLTSLVGVVIAAIFFVSQQNQAPAPVVPVPVPAEPNAVEPPAPQTNNTEVRERVIERTRELVPVPQPQAPAPTEAQQPVPQTQQPIVDVPTQPQSPIQQPNVVQPEVQGSDEPTTQTPATTGTPQ